MKKLTVFALFLLLAGMSLRATLLFTDNLIYPNGMIETDGLWYCYSPATPKLDAFVSNDLLILNSTNSDAVAAPTNGEGVVNELGGSIAWASFTINCSQLPTKYGGYFCIFKDNTNDEAAHIFVDTDGTVVPGTYRLGISDFATSFEDTGTTNFPLDLATGITYQVVFEFDTNVNASTADAELWVNPSTNDLIDLNNVFATDEASTPAEDADAVLSVSQIGFSQYADQGIVAIGNVNIGTSSNDFGFATIPKLPVFGVEPATTNLYPGNGVSLYTAASGIDETYQWYSNNVALVDNPPTVVGSQTPVLSVTNLSRTATYYVVVSNTVGSVQSTNAIVRVLAPSAPFFVLEPTGATNSLGSSITLSASANGSSPISYEWYYEQTNTDTFVAVASGASYTFPAAYAADGLYYVTASNGFGATNSTTNSVLVTPVPNVTIAYLHSFLTNDPVLDNELYFPNGNALYNVQGVVTEFGQLVYYEGDHAYCLYYIQDTNAAPGVGGATVFLDPGDASNNPPVGSYVNVTCEVEEYYGDLELNIGDPGTTNYVITNGLALPQVAPLNLALMSTNCMGSYGIGIQDSLVTLTNVYLFTTAGAPVSGNFGTNAETELDAYQTDSTNGPYIEVDVYTYTNAVNQFGTNLWGQPIPSFCYQLTGVTAIENFGTPYPLFYPQRYEDFVTTLPPSFKVGVAHSNSISTISWPAVPGSTYSVYGATNILGPWSQAFGLSYYPSIGSYTTTNAAATQFYKVSSP
ncbi:MAG: hypothetical protein ABR955_01690 [Verrucomicrobiota bacterium]